MFGRLGRGQCRALFGARSTQGRPWGPFRWCAQSSGRGSALPQRRNVNVPALRMFSSWSFTRAETRFVSCGSCFWPLEFPHTGRRGRRQGLLRPVLTQRRPRRHSGGCSPGKGQSSVAGARKPERDGRRLPVPRKSQGSQLICPPPHRRRHPPRCQIPPPGCRGYRVPHATRCSTSMPPATCR